MTSMVFVQARMGSSRLPNKVLKDICGKPDIQWVLERVSKSEVVDEVIVVTSIEKENVPLIELCTKMGFRVFIGSENDVLDRYYQAAKLLNPDIIIRVTADCPMIDWRYIDQAVGVMEDDSDYLWMGENAFPDGLDIEIMRYEALFSAWKNAKLQSEREHVTPYFRNHPELFKIQIFDFPIKGIENFRWTLDEDKDYEMISELYKHFISIEKEDFVTEDVVLYLKAHPEIEEINKMYTRNEGLIKSIREDYEVI